VSTRNGHRFVPLEFERLAPPEQIKRAREFESRMLTRRTVRKFSPQTVERELIESGCVWLPVLLLVPINSRGGLWRFLRRR
jgi:hypothetical protein